MYLSSYLFWVQISCFYNIYVSLTAKRQQTSLPLTLPMLQNFFLENIEAKTVEE